MFAVAKIEPHQNKRDEKLGIESKIYVINKIMILCVSTETICL